MTLWGVRSGDWPAALRDAGRQSLSDGVFSLAAGLTYFTVITLFPGLVAFVSVLVFLGRAQTVSSLLKIARQVGPTAGAATVSSPVHHVLATGASAGTLAFTASFAFVAASAYVSTLAWMSRRLRNEEPSKEPFWRRRRKQALVALAALGLLGVIALVLVLSPELFASAGRHVHRPQEALLLYRVARWPLLFGAAVVLFNLLYASSSAPPDHKRGWITGGSVVAILCWLLATLIYDVYVRDLGHYSSYYGVFGDLLAFLLWLWMLNIAVLGGIELNLQLDRRRAAAGGGRASGDEHGREAGEATHGRAAGARSDEKAA